MKKVPPAGITDGGNGLSEAQTGQFSSCRLAQFCEIDVRQTDGLELIMQLLCLAKTVNSQVS